MVSDGGNDQTERFSICSGGEESGFLSKREKEDIEKEKDVDLVLACPKISSYFPTNLALYILLSPIQVFNLKSA